MTQISVKTQTCALVEYAMLLINDATYINSMDAAKKANMKKEQKLGRRLGR